MFRRIALIASMLCPTGLTMACAMGCPPGAYIADLRSQQLYAEIQALTADRSSTDDGECGVAAVGHKACGAAGQYPVYSRATVDEDLLLEKIAEYNDLQDFVSNHYPVGSDCD